MRKPILTAQINKHVDDDSYDLEVIPVSRNPKLKSLSPFFLGPVQANGYVFANMENAWQYSKVYPKFGHLDSKGVLTDSFFDWLEEGSKKEAAVRYPAGRGAKPAFSLYRGMRLSYISARTLMYIPWYCSLIQEQDDFHNLVEEFESGTRLLIRDFDCYTTLSSSPNWFANILANSEKKMGHGFVLAAAIMNHKNPLWYKHLIV